MDIALTLESLIPGALYGGSLTENTQAAYENIRWEDAREKPLWAEIEAAHIVISRASKLSALAAYRYDREVAGIVIDGKNIATDRDTQSLITSTLKGFSLKPAGTTTRWRGEDGAWISVDEATLTAIGLVVWDYVEACWQNQEAHETAIKALATAAEIEAYDFTTGWPE